MKSDFFQSCGHCWVFQICWHIESSTFKASSFRIWNSSTGIPSPPLALFIVVLPKAHLISHSRISGSRWMITPLLLSGSWRYILYQFSSVQLLSRVRLFSTPWIAARQASLSITNSRSSLRLTSIKSMMPSSHLILWRPFLLLPPSLPASGAFPMSQLFAWGGQSIGASTLASVLPMNIQDWFPLELISLISLQSKGLSRVFSNTTV